MNSTLDFSAAYGGGYKGQKRSMIDSEAQKSLNAQLDKIDSKTNNTLQDMGLPKCHLDFSSLGNLNFEYFDVQASPINYKIFIKLRRIGDEIRAINNTFIDLIEEFKCCNTAEYYNDKVVDGIFRWIIEDFLGSLIDTVEGIIKAGHSIKIILCAIRPVPGNPWLKAGGYDWMNTLYSAVNGFDAIVDWIMDGNPLDAFLKPLVSFRKKLKACTKASAIFDDQDPTKIADDMLKKLIENYDSVETHPTDNQKIAYEDATAKLELSTSKHTLLIREISQLERDRRSTLAYIGENYEASSDIELELLLIDSKIDEKVVELEALKEPLEKAQEIYDVAEKLIAKAAETSLQTRYTSDALIRQNLDQIILDKYEPSCTCLAGFLGLNMNQPFEFVTVSTFSDIEDLLSTRVHSSDKEAWANIVDMLEDGALNNVDASTIKDLYINKDNIQDKYAKLNSSIDRDNLKNLRLWSDALFNHDYNSTVINYKYTNHNGAYITKEYNVNTDELLLFKDKEPTDTLLSLYSDDTDQSGIEINKQVFEKNEARTRERYRIAQERLILIQRRNKIEDQLNQVWNTLRRNALQQLKYNRYYEITNDASFNDKIILKTYNVIVNSYDYLYAQATLDRLGSSFDVVHFLQNFTSATNAQINELTDPVGASFDVDFKPEELYHVYDETFDSRPFIGDFQMLQSSWVELDESIGILDSAINKLDILSEMNNVVIQVVGTALTECGCDLLCKLIQWVVDLIISTANGLIKLIITKLVQAVMNEQVSYIIKMVIDKYKCYLDGEAFQDNMAKISERSDALKLMFDTGTVKDPGKTPLNYMQAATYCKVAADAKTKEAAALSDDTVSLPLDIPELQNDGTIISNPQPSFGVNDGPDEPGNRIINHGAEVKDAKTERNIPEIVLDCSVSKPSIEVVLEHRDTYEFMIAFKPSDYILTAAVQSIQQNQINTVDVVDADGNVINTSDAKAKVDNITDIIDNVQTQLSKNFNNELYIEPDCDDITADKENIIKLCSLENLLISEFKIIDDDLVVDDAATYGTLSSQLIYYDDAENIYENFYDVEPRLLKDAEKYFTYTIPENVETVTGPIITSQTRDAVDGEDHTPRTITNTDVSSTIDKIISIYTSIDYTYETVDNILKETTTISETTTVNQQFRYSNLEILVEFKNKVNRLQVRLTLDVLADRTFELPIDYDVGLYNGRYLNVANLGAVNASTGILIISVEKIYKVCETFLEESFMLPTPEEIIDDINKDSVDTCLLGEAEKTVVLKTQGSVDKSTIVIDKFSDDLKNVINNLDLPDPIITPESNPVSIPDIKYSIPFIFLNKEHNLMIQIVDRKIYLQFPSSAMVNAEPIIIDYELVPDNIYMFSFKFSGLLFNMSLITPDKEVISVKGINIDGYQLFPTILGGNVEGSSSFCGTFYDIIMSKSGNYMLQHNKKSLLSYVPRTSSILFDFELLKDGRVLNTIGKIGDRYTNSTDGVANKFSAPISPAEQQANVMGDVIIKKGFYQVFQGHMDNFFCKNNLIGQDFTVSLWLYSLKNLKTKHVIISDDINNIYVYYNAFEHKLVLDIQGVENFVYMTLNYWTHITFKHVLYSNSYQLIIHKLKNLEKLIQEEKFIIDVSSKVQFSLMGLFAEYDKEDRQYINKFNGLLSTISIFFNPINDSTYNDLHTNQSRLVRGMEKI